jgi:rubrerythrin
MSPNDPSENELRNKNETELPIGDPQAPAKRESARWRCSDCGEMGRTDGDLPGACPDCGAPRERLYRPEED